MDDDPKEKLDLAATATEASEIETRQVYLRDGRTLTVSGQGSQELVEIHASSGMLELRIKLTEQGPVLQMESVRLQLRASESVEVETKQFTVKAEESATIQSGGEVRLAGEADVRVDANGEVHVKGKMIYLN
ncbi:MAG: hypothetical protein KBG48_07005 [Kofleriaceae bacterium]|jgi:hypothetical protein|nr:hypothetical protein [Kofleriaceae bacterium]MBP9167117.1 hypothetical protein [Kofleriaceae bacterium]MBP9860944.1 hypothetical protein [Kofleriaceae bacterium]